MFCLKIRLQVCGNIAESGNHWWEWMVPIAQWVKIVLQPSKVWYYPRNCMQIPKLVLHVNLLITYIFQSNIFFILGVSELDKLDCVNYFELKFSFCYDRYIEFNRGDFLCCRLKGVPSQKSESTVFVLPSSPIYLPPKLISMHILYNEIYIGLGKGDRQHCELSTKGICNRYTVVVHGLVDHVERPESVCGFWSMSSAIHWLDVAPLIQVAFLCNYYINWSIHYLACNLNRMGRISQVLRSWKTVQNALFCCVLKHFLLFTNGQFTDFFDAMSKDIF